MPSAMACPLVGKDPPELWQGSTGRLPKRCPEAGRARGEVALGALEELDCFSSCPVEIHPLIAFHQQVLPVQGLFRSG